MNELSLERVVPARLKPEVLAWVTEADVCEEIAFLSVVLVAVEFVMEDSSVWG